MAIFCGEFFLPQKFNKSPKLTAIYSLSKVLELIFWVISPSHIFKHILKMIKQGGDH
jgi:hypothetical protein